MFKDAWLCPIDHAKGKKEYKNLILDIAVSFVDCDTIGYPELKEIKYTIYVPIDLEINFTHDKFQAWLGDKQQEKYNQERTKAIEVISKLKIKFPDLF
jgi:hypothetical protein